MLNFLQGKKTYIMALVAGVGLALFYAGIINDTVLKMLLAFTGVATIASIRSALQKLIDKLG